jgi:hypothetical protein
VPHHHQGQKPAAVIQAYMTGKEQDVIVEIAKLPDSDDD